jgi:bifunctional enzyme CysN/CysC
LTNNHLNIVIAGHVDHGKSTIVGRLLADSGVLPEGKLAQVKEYCQRNAKPFEYAFLIDALKNEQTQGVTIDAARVFFRLGNRDYILIDAPGHIEFIRNMVTGASRADAALLVVDAQEGIQENSRRHCTLLALLGIRQLAVLVNKMDLVSYDKKVFKKITIEFTNFLEHLGLKALHYIPVSGLHGEGIITLSKKMPWYTGYSVLDCISNFQREQESSEKQFRMWVQDVYKFTNDGDTRRIIAGTIERGSLKVGDHVIFHPSGKKSSVHSIETFNTPVRTAVDANEAIGFTTSDKIYISRGELATKVEEAHPCISSRLRASLFWLGHEPMVIGKDYTLKIGTAKAICRIEAIHSVQDGASLVLKKADFVGRNEIADCDMKLSKAIAFDLIDEVPATGRFVVVDNYEIRGGGIIREALEDKQSQMREKVLLRDYKWESSKIPVEERAARFRQKPALIIITGEKDSGKKPLAKILESELLSDGHFAYFLGIGNILYGVDSDIKGKINNRHEHVRRLAEVAHIMLDAGSILIVTAIELIQEELEIIQTTVAPDHLVTIWIGRAGRERLDTDLNISEKENIEFSVQKVKELLREKGIIRTV